MNRYVVLCDCESGGQPREIAYIDDDRTEGGSIHIDPNVFELETRQYFRGTTVTPNRRGDPNGSVTLRCSACRHTTPTITDARVGDIVDSIIGKLAIAAVQLAVYPSRPWDEPAEGFEDEYRQALLDDNSRWPWCEEYADHKGEWPWPAGIPRVTRYEMRLVIPFRFFRALNSNLPKRRE